MAREDDEPMDPRSTRSLRRDQPSTDRLNQADAAGDPLNPGWRSTRSNSRARRSGSVPFSGQELALWLQYGGWRFILAGVAILAVAATLYILSQPGPTPLPTTSEEPAAAPAVVATLPALATPTFAAVTPAPTAPPAAAGGQQLRVFGTEGQGLFLRAEPTTGNQPIATLPDGTVVTVVEGPTSAEGRTWMRVRSDLGEGWVASDFLQPVQ